MMQAPCGRHSGRKLTWTMRQSMPMIYHLPSNLLETCPYAIACTRCQFRCHPRHVDLLYSRRGLHLVIIRKERACKPAVAPMVSIHMLTILFVSLGAWNGFVYSPDEYPIFLMTSFHAHPSSSAEYDFEDEGTHFGSSYLLVGISSQ